MRNSIQDEGTLLLSARGYDERGCFQVHHHPIDVWRFSSLALDTLLDDTGWYLREPIAADPEAPGFFVVARA
jgi:hypothetical protein